MKKSQIYLIFSIILIITIFFLVLNHSYRTSLREDYYLNNYFETEISYLTSLNCSYKLNTLLDFLDKTNIGIKLLKFIDNCDLEEKTFYYVNIVVKNFTLKESNLKYEVCYDGFCKDLLKVGKHFCIVYELNKKIYFNCY